MYSGDFILLAFLQQHYSMQFLDTDISETLTFLRYGQWQESLLRKFADKVGCDWDRLLPYILFVYREVPQDTSQYQQVPDCPDKRGSTVKEFIDKKTMISTSRNKMEPGVWFKSIQHKNRHFNTNGTVFIRLQQCYVHYYISSEA